MIKDIQELNFPSYATMSAATVSLPDMGEWNITSQIKIDGQIAPDFSFDWEVVHDGHKYIMPLRKPQGSKENTSLNSVIDLTFQHWAIYQLKRWYFFNLPSTEAGVAWKKYITPVSLNLGDFIILFGQVLNYYYGDKITIDLNDDPETGWQYKAEPTVINISYTHIWDVLIKLYELFGVRWEIKPNGSPDKYVIKVGYPTTEQSHIFEYGFEGGLMKVERQVQSEEICNMLLGCGGEKNLPYCYFKNVDPENPSFKADPDWIEELANTYFSNLMPATFRSYVQGWKAAHLNATDSEGNLLYEGYTPVGEANAYAPWAYRKGFTDTKFDPVDYVADDITINPEAGDKQVAISPTYSPYVKKNSSIAKYGPLLNGLDNNEDIYPTIQGVTVDPYGRIDEVIEVEPITSDDIEEAAESDAQIATLPSAKSATLKVNNNARQIFTLNGELSVQQGKIANLITDLTVSGRSADGKTVDGVIIESYSVTLKNKQTGATHSASGIPEGSYTYQITANLHNASGKDLNVTVACPTPKLQSATPTDKWSSVWRIWVKNIWGTTKQGNETDEQYAERVWRPILGDRAGNEAKVVFASGLLAHEDYEFVITSIPKYERKKCTWQTVEGGQVVNHEYWSEWCIELGKSDAELDTLGVYLPSVMRQAKTGDFFLFIGIDMPHQYTKWGEERVDNWKKDNLQEKKDIKPTWVVQTDRVRLNNEGKPDALIRQLHPGDTLRLADKRFIEGAYETLYLSSLTITYREPTSDDAALNPDVEIVLSDRYEVSANPVSTLQGEVSALAKQVGSISNVEQIVRLVADKLYLRKDGLPDRSMSPTEFASLVTSLGFRAGMVGGAGWGFFKDENGNWVLETDRINVRQDMEVNNLVINQITARGGMIVESAANMEITRVEDTTNGYRCYFDQHEGTVANLFHLNDVAWCNRFTPENNSLKFYKRRVIEIGVDYVLLSKTNVNGSGIPAEGDTIVHYGNYSDKNRQFVKVRDVVGGGYERYIEGLDSVNATGTEYYFVGRQTGMYNGRPRWYVGDENGFIEWINGVLRVKGTLSMESTIGDKTISDYVNDAAQSAADAAKADLQSKIDELQDQIDGVVETWNGTVDPTKTNYPANGWTADIDKLAHIGDVYFNIGAYNKDSNPNAGHAWRWYYNSASDYGWIEIADSDAVRALQLAQMSVTGTDVLYKQTNSQTDAPDKPTVDITTGDITDYKGWNTKATAWVDGKYIWQTTYVKKGDGSATFSGPTCISGARGQQGPQGVPGEPGADGKTYYTWIRYADDANGTGISNSPVGKAYIGFAYNKETATESNIPSDYMWSKIEGTDGVPGAPGKDGKTYYTWIKYADNANGTGMYDIPNANTKYIGIAVNKESATEGTDPSEYTWSLFKGADGTSISISTQSVKYSTNHGATQPADSTFTLTAVPTLSAGQYLWSRTEVMYSNGQSTKSYAVSRIGTNGTNATIKSTSVTYAKTTTNVQPADSAFTATSIGALNIELGEFLWTKTTVTYSDNTPVTSYSVSRIGSDGIDGIPGTPGDDGKTSYVHFAYASGITGNLPHPTAITGFSTTSFAGVKYIGVCTDYNQADPITDVEQTYEWSEFKGADGNNAKSVTIAGDQIFTYADNFTSAATPASITLTATLQNTTGYQWSYRKEGDSGFTTINGATDATLTVAAANTTYFPAGKKSCTFRCTSEGVYDEMTIVKVSSGKDGETGGSYSPNLLLGTIDREVTATTTFNSDNINLGTLGGEMVTFSFDYEYSGVSTGAANTNNRRIGVEFYGKNSSGVDKYCGGWLTLPASSSGLNGSGRLAISVLCPEGIIEDVRTAKCYIQVTGGTVKVRNIKIERGSNPAPSWSPASSEMVGEDGYTVILTNENHTFIGDSVKAEAASTECGIIAYKGDTQMAAEIGEIAGLPSAGMTVTKANNGTTSAKFTVNVTTNLTKDVARSGTLTVPVKVDGKTFNRKFSWVLSLAGRGITGIVEEYAIHTSSTTAPADSEFSTAIKTMTDAKPYLWNREKTTYTDNTSETTDAICIGVKGQNGEPGATVVSVVNKYLASASASGVTTSTAGWVTDASHANATTSAEKPYLWNYEVTTWSKGNPTTTDPHVVGKYGKDGNGIDHIEEEYYLSTSSSTPTGGSWKTEANKPTWVAGKYMWTRSHVYYTDGTDETFGEVCVTGATGTSVLAQYSATGGSNASEWHPMYQAGDVWMRTSDDGGQNWSPAIRIVGSDYSPNLIKGTKDKMSAGTDNSEKVAFSYETDSEGFRVVTQFIKNGVAASGGNNARYWLWGTWGDDAKNLISSPNDVFIPGRTYTLSFDYLSPDRGIVGYIDVRPADDGTGTGRKSLKDFSFPASSEWKRVSVTFVCPQFNAGKTGSILGLSLIGNAPAGTTLKTRKICLVEGDSAQWVPASSEMVGKDGQYRKYQWGVTTSSTSADGITDWKNTPMTANPGYYVWVHSGIVVPPATEPTSYDPATRVTGDKGADGQSVYKLDLSDEMMPMPCDAAGNVVGAYSTSQASVYKGGSKVTSGITYSIAQQTGVSATISTSGLVTPSNLTADRGTILVQAVVEGVTLQTTLSLYKVKPGAGYAPNLLKDTQDGFTVLPNGPATSAYAQYVPIFFDGDIRPALGEKFAVQVESIQQIAGATDVYSVYLYGWKNNTHATLLGGPLNLSGNNLSGVIRVNQALPSDEAPALFIYPGRNGQLVGCQAKYGRIMLVRGETPVEWSPAASEMEGAVVYQIEPSVGNITKSMAGELSATSITCSVYKVTGNSPRELTSEKTVKMYDIKYDGSSVEYTKTPTNGVTSGVAVTQDTEAILCELWDGSVLLDRERVFVISDASDLEIGGVNLLRDSKSFRVTQDSTVSSAHKAFQITGSFRAGEYLAFMLEVAYVNGSVTATEHTVRMMNSDLSKDLTSSFGLVHGNGQKNTHVFKLTQDAENPKFLIYAGKYGQYGPSRTVDFARAILVRGNVPMRSWSAAPEDTNAEIAKYDYLKAALGEDNAMSGGLALRALLKMGQGISTAADGKISIAKVRAGMNGIIPSTLNPDNDQAKMDKIIAAWYGGDMIDRYYDESGNKRTDTPSGFANGLFRMDGTGYLSGGLIEFLANAIQLAGGKLIIDADGLHLTDGNNEKILDVTREAIGNSVDAFMNSSGGTIFPSTGTGALVAKLNRRYGSLPSAEVGGQPITWNDFTGGETAITKIWDYASKGQPLYKGSRIYFSVPFPAANFSSTPSYGTVKCRVSLYHEHAANPSGWAEYDWRETSGASWASFNGNIGINVTYNVSWAIKVTYTRTDISQPSGTSEDRNMTFNANAFKLAVAPRSRTLLAPDGFLSAWGQTAALVNQSGIWLRFGNFGLRLDSDGIKAMTDGTNWKNIQTK